MAASVQKEMEPSKYTSIVNTLAAIEDAGSIYPIATCRLADECAIQHVWFAAQLLVRAGTRHPNL